MTISARITALLGRQYLSPHHLAEPLRRALQRDLSLFGSTDLIEERYRRRYFPAQRHYLVTCWPEERATFVVDNENPIRPRIIMRPEQNRAN